MSDTTQTYPDQPEGIDETTRDLPTLSGAHARVSAFLSEFGDGAVMRLDDDGPTLYARDLEVLLQLAQQDWVHKTLELIRFAENECADASCHFHDTIGQHATYQHTDGAQS